MAKLQETIAGEELLIGSHEPIGGYFAAVIDDNGLPAELIRTGLRDDTI